MTTMTWRKPQFSFYLSISIIMFFHYFLIYLVHNFLYQYFDSIVIDSRTAELLRFTIADSITILLIFLSCLLLYNKTSIESFITKYGVLKSFFSLFCSIFVSFLIQALFYKSLEELFYFLIGKEYPNVEIHYLPIEYLHMILVGILSSLSSSILILFFFIMMNEIKLKRKFKSDVSSKYPINTKSFNFILMVILTASIIQTIGYFKIHDRLIRIPLDYPGWEKGILINTISMAGDIIELLIAVTLIMLCIEISINNSDKNYSLVQAFFLLYLVNSVMIFFNVILTDLFIHFYNFDAYISYICSDLLRTLLELILHLVKALIPTILHFSIIFILYNLTYYYRRNQQALLE